MGEGQKKWREGAEIKGSYELNRVFNTWGKIYTKNLWSGLSGPDPLVDSDADPKERPIERRDRDRRVICQCGYHVTGSAE